MPVDLDLDLGVEAACDGVRATGVHDAPVPWAGRATRNVVESLVEVAERRRREVDDLDVGRGDGGHTSAFSHT